MAAAKKRPLDAVLVCRYNRFARSTQALVNTCKEFLRLGWALSPTRKTATPPELIFHVVASLAQFESALISQRVRAGIARAKAQGKHVARPLQPRLAGSYCAASERGCIHESGQQAVRRGLWHGIQLRSEAEKCLAC